jgi:hypothetical protein
MCPHTTIYVSSYAASGSPVVVKRSSKTQVVKCLFARQLTQYRPSHYYICALIEREYVYVALSQTEQTKGPPLHSVSATAFEAHKEGQR